MSALTQCLRCVGCRSRGASSSSRGCIAAGVIVLAALDGRSVGGRGSVRGSGCSSTVYHLACCDCCDCCDCDCCCCWPLVTAERRRSGRGGGSRHGAEGGRREWCEKGRGWKVQAGEMTLTLAERAAEQTAEDVSARSAERAGRESGKGR